MEKVWVITIAIVTFLVLSFLSYRILERFVRNTFGKKWLTRWGNKLYFWQSLVFMSTAGTFLVMFLLKCGSILTF